MEGVGKCGGGVGGVGKGVGMRESMGVGVGKCMG